MNFSTILLSKYFFFFFIFVVVLFASQPGTAQVILKKQTTLMGSVFNFTVVDKNNLTAKSNLDDVINEIERIENLISEWRPETQISKVNKNAGIEAVKVDREVFDLTKRAIDYAKMTDGAFDISIAALDQIWKFDGSMDTLPNQEAIKKTIKNIGYQNIILDSVNCTIFLARKGMKIGFGSIGKGYAADRGKELLQAKGVIGGIVNASGDMATWGNQLNGKPWVVGITNPFKTNRIYKKIKLKDHAVVTSGSYEKFAEINGVRYSHIINPKTGYPAIGLISVTVVGPSAEFANALSTSIMVLGKKEGLKLLKRYPKYKGILIKDRD
ncbi:MAG: FAD:protein FMN transferase [Bacteroidota bacterium]